MISLNPMEFKHQLDEWPPFLELMLLGLQWFTISIPGIIIVGNVVGTLNHSDPTTHTVYLQRLSFMVSISVFAQIVWGHRLPLIIGPSTVLLIGVIASAGFDPNTVYSSIMIGGAVLALLGFSRLFGHVQRLFTSRVIALVLILIALTLVPTVIRLISTSHREVSAFANFVFAFALTASMFLSYLFVSSLWKSTMILWAMVAGSVTYHLIFPRTLDIEAIASERIAGLFLHGLTTRWTLEPGVLISFLFCFFALSMNDVGSIQSMKEILKPSNMHGRINRGLTFTGLANVLAGFLGIVGPVNFSLSPGVIAATRSASRFTLIPASLLLFFISFSPLMMSFLGNIPPAVIGSSLIYVLCFQVIAGKNIAFRSRADFTFKNILVIGFPALIGTIIAFLPPSSLLILPVVLRPIIGNGFVIGVLSALVLEHLIFRKKIATT